MQKTKPKQKKNQQGGVGVKGLYLLLILKKEIPKLHKNY